MDKNSVTSDISNFPSFTCWAWKWGAHSTFERLISIASHGRFSTVYFKGWAHGLEGVWDMYYAKQKANKDEIRRRGRGEMHREKYLGRNSCP